MFLSEKIFLSDQLIYLIFLDLIGGILIINGSIYLTFNITLLDLPWLNSSGAIAMVISGILMMIWSVPHIFTHLLRQLAGDISRENPKYIPKINVEEEIIYQGVDMEDYDQNEDKMWREEKKRGFLDK